MWYLAFCFVVIYWNSGEQRQTQDLKITLLIILLIICLGELVQPQPQDTQRATLQPVQQVKQVSLAVKEQEGRDEETHRLDLCVPMDLHPLQ